MKTKLTISRNYQSNFRSLPRLRRYAAAVSVAVAIASSLGFVRSSTATSLLFTLTDVTLDDGAIAIGSFVFDPTTEMYGAFNITTTDGLAFMGSNYSPMAGTFTDFPDPGGTPDIFTFDNFSVDSHYLQFSYSDHITGAGMYAIDLGSAGPLDSYEFVDASFDYRLVTGGFLTVTDLPSVPETGGTLLCLTIGIGALAGFQRRVRVGANQWS